MDAAPTSEQISKWLNNLENDMQIIRMLTAEEIGQGLSSIDEQDNIIKLTTGLITKFSDKDQLVRQAAITSIRYAFVSIKNTDTLIKVTNQLTDEFSNENPVVIKAALEAAAPAFLPIDDQDILIKLTEEIGAKFSDKNPSVQEAALNSLITPIFALTAFESYHSPEKLKLLHATFAKGIASTPQKQGLAYSLQKISHYMSLQALFAVNSNDIVILDAANLGEITPLTQAVVSEIIGANQIESNQERAVVVNAKKPEDIIVAFNYQTYPLIGEHNIQDKIRKIYTIDEVQGQKLINFVQKTSEMLHPELTGQILAEFKPNYIPA